MVERIKGRLRKWDSKSISMGGRVTLIRSVLLSLPLYALSLLEIPKTVEKNIRPILYNFFLGRFRVGKKDFVGEVGRNL